MVSHIIERAGLLRSGPAEDQGTNSAKERGGVLIFRKVAMRERSFAKFGMVAWTIANRLALSQRRWRRNR